ncbi:uncharacterized protein LOC120636664 isoform X2 [Pararge aegeria]|uniref:uncharacterized protein LOC120636664 isoform X2 n=1 Tax=Pararge aegeria TaxID=116150 RepID=UPI0019D269EF|nr:uncharacterized protein LOC120636664 isoform X2 [Pararge aegeria]
MSKNIVFEGWLTKSPPSKRIWRTVDAGLHMERGTHGSLDPKLRGSVFTIQTQTRTYHLEADCEADMERWVDAICRVCGLRATDDAHNTAAIYQNHSVTIDNQENIALRVVNENRRRQAGIRSANNTVNTISGRRGLQQPLMANASTMTSEQYGGAESTGSYIPISECITGVRAQENIHIAFNFDPKNILISTKKPFEKSDSNDKRIYLSQPQIIINSVEVSENESNLSDDECRSLNTSQSNIGGCDVSKTFTKLSVAPQGIKAVNEEGPPVPPRPPKTFTMNKDLSQKGRVQAHKYVPVEVHDNNPNYLRVPRRSSRGNTPPSPGCSAASTSVPRTDDEEEPSAGHSMQYCNLVTEVPPVVDRALKPRLSSHTNASVSTIAVPTVKIDEPKPDRLQYLDLDLPTKPSTSNSPDAPIIVHGKSRSSDADSAYKTVDFLKTEAFNITRQDAEASRNMQQ